MFIRTCNFTNSARIEFHLRAKFGPVGQKLFKRSNTEKCITNKFLTQPGSPGACSPGKILKYRVPEMPFPAFWGETLENSEAYKTS